MATLQEQALAGTRKVFGAGFQPASIFEKRGLLEKGISGAVRVKGRPEVFTIGPGGKRIESPEEFKGLFGTLEQKGIVGEITAEQAQQLGIRASFIPTAAPKLPEAPATQDELKTSDDVGISDAAATDAEVAKEAEAAMDRINAAATAEQKKAELEAFEAGEAAKAAAAKTTAETEKAGLIDKFKAAVAGRKSIEDVREEEFEKLVPEEDIKKQRTLISEIEGFSNQLMEIHKEAQNEIIGAETTPMLLRHREGNVRNAEIRGQRRAAVITAQIGVKTAILNALRGQVTQARALVSDIVSAVTMDRAIEVQTFNTFMNINKDAIAGFDEDIKTFLDNQRDQLETDLANAKEEKKEIANLFIDAADKGVILPGDIATATLEDTRKAYTESVGLVAEEERELDIAEQKARIAKAGLGVSPSATAGFFNSETEQDFREDYQSLFTQIVRNPKDPQPEELEEIYTTLRRLYSPQEVSEKAAKKLLGIKETTDVPSSEDIADAFLEDTTKGIFDFLSPESIGQFVDDPFGVVGRRKEKEKQEIVTRQHLIVARDSALRAGNFQRAKQLEEALKR